LAPATPVDGAFDEALEDYTLTAAFSSWGTHLLKIRAANTVGNSRDWNFVVGTEPSRPVAAFAYSPTNPIVGQTISFDASSSYDPNGTIMSYLWDFGDGTTTNVTGAGVSHTYTSASTNTVSLTVTGPVGSDSKTRTAYIVVVNPAHLEVTPSSRDFGSVTIGQTNELTFSVINTGDGAALAYSVGVALEDMEFVQFFPFALAEPGQPSYHIGEALAEEGKIIMQYFYAHNYRGFTRAVIPISQVTFLVGENSTGKSSRQ
jgi:hypothetical protein